MSNAGIATGFNDEGRWEPERLIAGEFPRVSQVVAIVGAQDYLPMGAVLGEFEPGVYSLSQTSASEGSQVPVAILAQTVQLIDNQGQAFIYLSGEFNASALLLGEGHTLESVTAALRLRSIFIR